MASAFEKSFIESQIAELKGQLAANSEATRAALSAQGYALDSGQTRQSVTRAQLSSLRQQRIAILDELQYWQSQLGEGGTTRVTPGW